MEIKINRLILLSNHPVLDQLAEDIAAGVLPEALPLRDIVVCIGAHKRFPGLMKRSAFKICLQTEHIFDANAQPLWFKPRRWIRLVTNLFICNFLLDLSPHNKRAYRWLPSSLRKKIIFGPKIFPSKPVSYSPGNGKFVFYGALNDRRKALLNGNESFTVLDNGAYGAQLVRKIAEASAVLNVHFASGVYTEYPRLLSAYLAGKPLISEMLSHELEPGRHYLLFGETIKVEEMKYIFEKFSEEFALNNRFTDFLSHCGDKVPSQ